SASSASLVACYFLFSSRRRHTRSTRDWSSDVCSSDLHNWQSSVSVQQQVRPGMALNVGYFRTWYGGFLATDNQAVTAASYESYRSEERRVGKEWTGRGGRTD